MVNNQPHSTDATEKMSEANLGSQGKLGWRAPEDVLQRMRDGASRRGTQELGIDITNQIFQDLYPRAQFISDAHRYDFILNDVKVDVKGAIFSKGHWAYAIQRNKIADVFFLMAFDEDYNLLKMWCIPASDISHLTGIAISKGTFRRWEEYDVRVDF